MPMITRAITGTCIGLDPNLYPSLGSAGIRMFTIGLGKNMVC